ncbi:hypothetical protein LEP1GSC150_5404, partial [Leptospira interrogans serovar Copenhageni str. LT2050]
ENKIPTKNYNHTILFMSNYLYSQKSFEIYANLIFIEKLPMPYEIVTLKINNIYSKRNLSKLEFLILLSKAKRIRPKDEKLRSWHYSSWCNRVVKKFHSGD